jgi:hypothetical protein
MEPSFEPGSTVVVFSLASRSDLNGRRGIVQSFMPESGRYRVLVDGEQASIALKPANLQAAPAVGSKVILVSLVSRSDLNGRTGFVQTFNCATARFEVKVEGEDTILSLKPLNLREVVSSDVASFIKIHKGSKQKQK